MNLPSRSALFAMAVFGLVLGLIGCETADETVTGSGSKTALAKPTNLRAYSASAISVGLTWTPSTDAAFADFLEYQITVKAGTSTVSTVSAPKNAASSIISGLIEGTVYTFQLVAKASSTSQNYMNSDSVTVQWAPARRLGTEGVIPIAIYEISSTAGGSGLQFFHAPTAGPRVLSISQSAGFQQVIDVLLAGTGSNIVLKSAHLNPLLSGQARITKFSTIDTPSDTLDIGQASPPSTGTYTQDSVFIGAGAGATGKIFYAVSNDNNYVRIFVRRDQSSGTLLFGAAPDRRIVASLSYQGVAGVPFAKPTVRKWQKFTKE